MVCIPKLQNSREVKIGHPVLHKKSLHSRNHYVDMYIIENDPIQSTSHGHLLDSTFQGTKSNKDTFNNQNASISNLCVSLAQYYSQNSFQFFQL